MNKTHMYDVAGLILHNNANIIPWHMRNVCSCMDRHLKFWPTRVLSTKFGLQQPVESSKSIFVTESHTNLLGVGMDQQHFSKVY